MKVLINTSFVVKTINLLLFFTISSMFDIGFHSLIDQMCNFFSCLTNTGPPSQHRRMCIARVLLLRVRD